LGDNSLQLYVIMPLHYKFLCSIDPKSVTTALEQRQKGATMQIPKSDRSRSYELTYLVPGSLTSDKVGEVQAIVDKLLKKNGCKQSKVEEWGKKTMAYSIKNQGKKEVDAVYFHVLFDAPTQAVAELSRDLRLSQTVMRFLVVLAEKDEPTTEISATPEEKNSDPNVTQNVRN
jgi:small subunit ribosomal protein S6